MTFKELAEQTLKEYPEGIWVHFQIMYNRRIIRNRCIIRNEIYLDAESLDDFEGLLKKEVVDYYVDDFAYDVLEVTLKD